MIEKIKDFETIKVLADLLSCLLTLQMPSCILHPISSSSFL